MFCPAGAHGAEKVCDPSQDDVAPLSAADYDAIISGKCDKTLGTWGAGDDGWGADAEREQETSSFLLHQARGL